MRIASLSIPLFPLVVSLLLAFNSCDSGGSSSDSDFDSDGPAEDDDDATIGEADVRALDLMHRNTGLQITLAEEPLADDLRFGEGTPFSPFTSGSQLLRILDDELAEPVEITLALVEDERHTVALFGDFEFFLLNNPPEPNPNEVPAPRPPFQFLHAAPSKDPVDVYLPPDLIRGEGDLILVFDDLDYAERTGYLARFSATTLGLDEDDDGAVDVTFDISGLADYSGTNFYLAEDATGRWLLVVHYKNRDLPDIIEMAEG